MACDLTRPGERAAGWPLARRYGNVRRMGRTVGLQALRAFRADLYGCFRPSSGRPVRTGGCVAGERGRALAAASEPARRPSARLGQRLRRARGGRGRRRSVRAALAARPLTDGQPIYAVDVSAWPRCDAEASPERGYYYHPSRHSAGQPIVAGWAYQWLAQLSFGAIAGPRRWMCGACGRPRDAGIVAIAQITRAGRVALAARPCRCSCSTPATTRCS